ncbi:hypothetical protein TYRP_002871 [Tyrophagus putrescentiae]|nr:hypothetical protein TYRP_002871 [Tyrophagus putrescentiae]
MAASKKEPLTLGQHSARVLVLNRLPKSQPPLIVDALPSSSSSSSNTSSFSSTFESSSSDSDSGSGSNSSNNNGGKTKGKKRMKSLRDSKCSQTKDKDTPKLARYTFLDQLIKPEQQQQQQQRGGHRFVLPLSLQLLIALLFLGVVGFVALEPLLPEWAAVLGPLEDLLYQELLLPFSEAAEQQQQQKWAPKRQSTRSTPAQSSRLGSRLAVVFQGSLYSLLWLLALELWKVYLRTVNDLHNSSSEEVSLSEQINRNGRIKSAERLHAQCLSQLLLSLLCQLYLVFEDLDPPSSPLLLLPRLVLAFNLLFAAGRLVDIAFPRRLRLVSSLLVYTPCLLVCGHFLRARLLKLAGLFLYLLRRVSAELMQQQQQQQQ